VWSLGPPGTGGLQRPPVSCFAGHYCPGGTMFPTQYKCPVGSWSGRSGLERESECGPCPPGWYCLAGAGAPSGRCSSGHHCPEGENVNVWEKMSRNLFLGKTLTALLTLFESTAMLSLRLHAALSLTTATTDFCLCCVSKTRLWATVLCTTYVL